MKEKKQRVRKKEVLTDKRREYLGKWQRAKNRADRDIGPMVAELLEKVDLKKRAKLESNPAAWLREMFPESYSNPFTDDQKKRIDAIVDIINTRGVQARAEPRGDGKTIISEGLVVWAIVKGLIRFLVLVSANTEQAKSVLNNIYSKINSDEFVSWYPEVAYAFVEIGNVKQRQAGQHLAGVVTNISIGKEKVVFPTIKGVAASGAVIRAYGMDKPIRGVREGNQRPDFFLVDDPETPESSRSVCEIKKRSDRLDKEISKLGGPGRKVSGLILTTIQAKESVSDIYTDIKRKPAWGGVRNKSIYQWPTNNELWEKYIDLRQTGQMNGDKNGTEATEFYKKNRKLMDMGAVLSNPYVFDQATEISALQSCYNFIADRGMESFQTEYQNDPPLDKQEDGFELSASAVQKRCCGEKQTIIPDAFQYLTAGIDVGGRICYWVVKAWCDEMIGHVTDYGVLPIHAPLGDLKSEELQSELEDAIRLALFTWHDDHYEQYCYRSGEVKKIDCVAIDAGYQTHAIYNFIRDMQTRAYIPIMGYGTNSKRGKYLRPKSTTNTTFVGKGWHRTFHSYDTLKVWLHHCDDDYYKFKVQQGFVLPAGSPGSITLFGDEPYYHKTYARSIVSEKRVEEFKPGRGLTVEYRVKDRNQNHYLDATKYARAAASIIGIPELKRPEQPAQQPKERLRKSGSSGQVSIRTKY